MLWSSEVINDLQGKFTDFLIGAIIYEHSEALIIPALQADQTTTTHALPL